MLACRHMVCARLNGLCLCVAQHDGWWPIVLVTIFNCFDLTGRTLAGYTAHLISGNTVFVRA